MILDVVNPAKAPVSVLVLTRDEAANIGECLESLRWADEVFVVDSLSTDRTAEIARALQAKVHLHPFVGYADQRNWALQNLPFAHDWVLMLDADERIPKALADEISVAVSRQDTYSGFYMARRIFFMGTWLKHGGLYPTWLLRLFKRQRARVEERPVNEHVIVNGSVGYLAHPFDHADRRPLGDWVTKQNRYADLQTEEYLREKSRLGFTSSIRANLRGSQAERKRWIKLRIWNRLPLLFRPLLFFTCNYFLRGGFLAARAVFIYHILWSFWIKFLIDVKVMERESTSRRRGSASETGDRVQAIKSQSKKAAAS